MVDRLRDVDRGTVQTIGSVVAALAATAMLVTQVTLWISNGTSNSHDMLTLKSQVTDLRGEMAAQISAVRADISRLNDRVEQGPRADQLQEILRHLSAQDGRMDSYDVRMRTLETQQAGMAARLEAIDAASRLQLPRK